MLKKIFRDRGLRYWLPAYIMQVLSGFVSGRPGNNKIKHIMFLICDHYEPKHHITRPGQDVERVTTWRTQYPEFAARCQNQFGHYPKHSWFYPPHHGLEHLSGLNELVFNGYGETELHYHHDNDTSEKFTRDLNETIENYNQMGLLLGSGDQLKPCFSFIHGDWALDNSAHGKYCGVNDELTILQNAGCWGDFTMPSTEECQTRKINSIYYAIDDPDKPKSHDTGKDAAVGVKNPPGFFMMQGPLGINWGAPRLPKIENSSLTTYNWGRADRVDYWVNCGIHVKGKPDWVFVKLHTHGAVEKDHDALIGERAFKMHQYLNEKYNDGVKYKLHYVTAREAYNICKAAEEGLDGDPGDYVNHVIKPYANTYYMALQPHVLKACTRDSIELEYPDEISDKQVYINGTIVKAVTGQVSYLKLDSNSRSLVIRTGTDKPVVISTQDGCFIENVSSGDFEKTQDCFLVKNHGDEVVIRFNKN